MALISVVWIWMMWRPFLISVHKRQAAEDSVFMGVMRTMVFFEVALANMKRKCPAIV